MTAGSGIVTGDSGETPEIGHVKTERAVTITRNGRSRQNGMSGHVGAEYAIDSLEQLISRFRLQNPDMERFIRAMLEEREAAN